METVPLTEGAWWKLSLLQREPGGNCPYRDRLAKATRLARSGWRTGGREVRGAKRQELPRSLRPVVSSRRGEALRWEGAEPQPQHSDRRCRQSGILPAARLSQISLSRSAKNLLCFLCLLFPGCVSILPLASSLSFFFFFLSFFFLSDFVSVWSLSPFVCYALGYRGRRKFKVPPPVLLRIWS